MQELALVINNPVEGHWLQHIDWNKEEFEAKIEEATKDYADLAYTEDQIKQAKADRASLNKIKKAIEDRRKEVKRAVNAPYDTFEKEVKEVTAKLDSAIAQIDAQVKASEEKQKAEKKIQIESYFQSAVGDLIEKVRFDRIFEQSWLNSTASMASVKQTIDAKLETIRNGYRFFEAMGDDEKSVGLMAYEKNFDLGLALADVNAYRQKKESNDRLKAQNDERLKNMTGETRTGEPDEHGLESVAPVITIVEAEEEDNNKEKIVKTISVPFNGTNLDYILGVLRGITTPKRGSISISFLGTDTQIQGVLSKMESNGIKFKEEE